VLINSSLSAVGWVCGGAPTIVRSLLDLLGPDGTVMAPAFSTDNRDPSRWRRPVPEEWWPAIRAELPAFDPAVTPCAELGRIAETIRTWPGARRSDHPQTSFAAVGRYAATLTAGHPITSELGPESPLGRLSALDGHVLLLGVGFDRCTAFHLAEYGLPQLGRRSNRCVAMTPTGRTWVEYEAATLDDSDFARLGAALERDGDVVRTGKVGNATAHLFPVRPAVRFAVSWLANRRIIDGVKSRPG